MEKSLEQGRQKHQYELVKKVLPDVVYDPVSGILKIEKEKEHIGKVAVCTAGTADISVAEEDCPDSRVFRHTCGEDL